MRIAFVYCLAPQLDVYAYMPANTKAIDYVFHGGEGSDQMWIPGDPDAADLQARYPRAIVLNGRWYTRSTFITPIRFTSCST